MLLGYSIMEVEEILPKKQKQIFDVGDYARKFRLVTNFLLRYVHKNKY